MCGSHKIREDTFYTSNLYLRSDCYKKSKHPPIKWGACAVLGSQKAKTAPLTSSRLHSTPDGPAVAASETKVTWHIAQARSPKILSHSHVGIRSSKPSIVVVYECDIVGCWRMVVGKLNINYRAPHFYRASKSCDVTFVDCVTHTASNRRIYHNWIKYV